MGKPHKVKVKNYRAEVWQDGMMVASVEGPRKKEVLKDINHYAFMYMQDGPVEIRYDGYIVIAHNPQGIGLTLKSR